MNRIYKMVQIKNQKKKELRRLRVIAVVTIFLSVYIGLLSEMMSNPGIVPDVEAKTQELCELDSVVCGNEKLPEIRDYKQTNKDYIKQIAEEHNFQWTDYLLRLANCESQYLKYEKFKRVENKTPVWGMVNGKRTIVRYIKTIDRGIFQINDVFHPEVKDECTDNIRCATEWTMWRIESGYQHEWMCDALIKANPNYYRQDF